MRLSFLPLLKHQRMTPVIFALFTEFLMLATFGFMVLLSLKILLPSFVSARVNLALFFGSILSLFVLHHALSVWLDQEIRSPKRYVVRTCGIFLGLWGITLLVLSLFKFPVLAVVTILLLCSLLAYLFRKILLTV